MSEAELLACEVITPQIAGEYLHKDPQTVRYWLQDKAVDFGMAYRRQGCRNWQYYISAEKLIKFKKGGAI